MVFDPMFGRGSSGPAASVLIKLDQVLLHELVEGLMNR